MAGHRLLLVPLVVGLCAGPAFAQVGQSQPPAADGPAASSTPKEHGLPREAGEVACVFGLPVTNSMVVTWITAIIVIVVARVATRHMREVPGGAQNFVEWLVEGLYTVLEGIIGRHLVGTTFWFFASVFIFILAANCVGLVPGAGTVGWGHRTGHGFEVDRPLFRGPNADLNMTLAMALVFFGAWIVWSLRELGPLGCLKELFGPKGESTGLMRVVMGAVFFAAGCLEIISILFRPVSLSFRLYGNTFAGETLLDTVATVFPALGWLLPVPFYLLELLVAVVQATVFMLLTAVFTLLMCGQEEEPAPAAE
jgi:F-type H+-transporting ATPase subunit a